MRLASALILVAAMGTAAVIDWGAWQESYGDGSPHYGLTTNMDKWSDPRPFLVAVNGVALVVVAFVLWFGPSWHNRRADPGGHHDRAPRSAG